MAVNVLVQIAYKTADVEQPLPLALTFSLKVIFTEKTLSLLAIRLNRA
jgi:hypothetical protein